VKQKKKLEQQLEIFNKEKIDFEAEKEKVNSILNIESKLEEIKKENFKRLKILKKIKQEKLLIEEERKKLEELKESLNNSDIDLDEVTI
jgi:predicted site-specific integrase-resolvase